MDTQIGMCDGRKVNRYQCSLVGRLVGRKEVMSKGRQAGMSEGRNLS